jgi:hypothetical protein
MKVKRILANVKARNIGDAKRFYEKVLGLEQLMIWGGLPPTVPMPNQLLPSPLQLSPHCNRRRWWRRNRFPDQHVC